MYEELTAESIKSDILSRIVTDIDTREGSFTNDMISGIAYEIWKLYQSLDAVVPITFVDETSGEYIDKRCGEYGITRKPGSKAAVMMRFTGAEGMGIPAGTVFLTSDGQEFETDAAATIAGGEASVTATAAEDGEAYNVPAGTITRQIISISGLSGITNDAATGGTDPETDAALVGRLNDYLQKPATSGNAYHYEQWALSVNGVGAAKVTPLWDGPGTVRVLVVGQDKGPADPSVVSACAEYIGENRPIGADVTVESAEGLPINISASVTIDETTTKETVQEEFSEALNSYLKSIAFVKYELVFNRIAYILLDIPGVIDFTSMTVNGGTENIAIGASQVPVLGTVEVV